MIHLIQQPWSRESADDAGKTDRAAIRSADYSVKKSDGGSFAGRFEGVLSRMAESGTSVKERSRSDNTGADDTMPALATETGGGSKAGAAMITGRTENGADESGSGGRGNSTETASGDARSQELKSSPLSTAENEEMESSKISHPRLTEAGTGEGIKSVAGSEPAKGVTDSNKNGMSSESEKDALLVTEGPASATSGLKTVTAEQKNNALKPVITPGSSETGATSQSMIPGESAVQSGSHLAEQAVTVSPAANGNPISDGGEALKAIGNEVVSPKSTGGEGTAMTGSTGMSADGDESAGNAGIGNSQTTGGSTTGERNSANVSEPELPSAGTARVSSTGREADIQKPLSGTGTDTGSGKTTSSRSVSVPRTDTGSAVGAVGNTFGNSAGSAVSGSAGGTVAATGATTADPGSISQANGSGVPVSGVETGGGVSGNEVSRAVQVASAGHYSARSPQPAVDNRGKNRQVNVDPENSSGIRVVPGKTDSSDSRSAGTERLAILQTDYNQHSVQNLLQRDVHKESPLTESWMTASDPTVETLAKTLKQLLKGDSNGLNDFRLVKETEATSGSGNSIQQPVPTHHIERNQFAGRLVQVVRQELSNGNPGMKGWKNHQFVFDDGSKMQLSVRQLEGSIQLQLGSLNSELNRLIHQHVNDIKQLLQDQMKLNVELHFQNNENTGQFPGGASDNTGRALFSGNEKEDASGELLPSSNKRQELPERIRDFGFNKNEWTA